MATTWRAEVEIAAPPSAVWEVLTQFDAYPSWNPFTVEVSTSGQIGDAVRMRVRLGAGALTHQTETLRVMEPERCLAWALDQPPRWLLWAFRNQTLTALENGRTLYVTEDTIGGLLGPLVRLLYDRALRTGFDNMAQALRRRVESGRA